MSIQKKKIFHFNSGSQLTESNNTFQVDLQLEDGYLYDRISLLSCNIPISYYTIQQGENIFNLNEDSKSVSISVPIGNYNISSFCSVIQTLLNTYSPNAYTYQLYYPQNFKDTSTGKIQYFMTSYHAGLKISFSFPENSPIYQQFGFDQGTSDFFTEGNSSYFINSKNVVSFIPENSIYIHSSLISGIDSPSPKFSSCLQEVYNENNVMFGVLAWSNSCPIETSRRFVQTTTTKATFSITDEFAYPVFLNGLDIVMTIMVFKIDDTLKKLSLAIDGFQAYNIEGIIRHLIDTLSNIEKKLENLNENKISQIQ